MGISSHYTTWNPFKFVNDLQLNACFSNDDENEAVFNSSERSGQYVYQDKRFGFASESGQDNSQSTSSYGDNIMMTTGISDVGGKNIQESHSNSIVSSNITKISSSTVASFSGNVNNDSNQILDSEIDSQCSRLELIDKKMLTNSSNSWFFTGTSTSTSIIEKTPNKIMHNNKNENENEQKIIINIQNEKLEIYKNLYEMSQEDMLQLKIQERQRFEYITYLEQKVNFLAKSSDDLYSRIAKMQGNIRVLCKIKPNLHVSSPTSTPSTSTSTSTSTAYSNNSNTIAPTNTNTTSTASTGDSIISIPDFNRLYYNNIIYEFDTILGPDTTQEECYMEIEQTVTPVLNGCKVCIFAYGQTGSGKTFTMQGPAHSPGVNYRAIETIFKNINKDCDFITNVYVSMLEVYNEQVIDLLGKNPPSHSVNSSLEVRLGKDGVYVEDLASWRANCVVDVQVLLDKGHAVRKIACNNINEHSSRAHLVVIVK
eukprot:gene5980-12058_t